MPARHFPAIICLRTDGKYYINHPDITILNNEHIVYLLSYVKPSSINEPDKGI